MTAELKTEKIQLRLTREEREALQKLADREKMSVSGYIRWIINRESKKRQP